MTDTAGAWVSDMVGGLVSAGNPLLRDLWLASPADQGMTEGRGHEELVEAAAVAEENDPKRLTASASGFVESVVEGLVVEGETVEMGDETSSSAGRGVVSVGGSSAAVDAAGVDGAQEKWGDWFYFNDASVSRVSWRQQPGGAAPPAGAAPPTGRGDAHPEAELRRELRVGGGGHHLLRGRGRGKGQGQG